MPNQTYDTNSYSTNSLQYIWSLHTTSSWWSTGAPLPIKCLTTSRWPSEAARWRAVCPVWNEKYILVI